MSEIKVEAAIGGRRITLDPITLDPIRTIPVTFGIREVESTIPCGFQVEWGSGEIDGEPIEIYTGAGFGSRWATIHYQGRDYCFKAEDIISALLDALAANKENHGITFVCEACRARVSAKDIDGLVECPACGHTVDVGVYVVNGES